MLILLLLSYFFVANGLHLANHGVWGAAILVCPFGSMYFWYGQFAGHYLAHMIFALLCFGLIIRIGQMVKRFKRYAGYLFLVLLSFMSGINGVKTLMGFYAAKVVCALVLFFYVWHTYPKRFPRYEFSLMITSILAFVSSSIGYLINSTVLSKLYWFSDYNNRIWGGCIHSKNIRVFFIIWLSYGYVIEL